MSVLVAENYLANCPVLLIVRNCVEHFELLLLLLSIFVQLAND